MNGRTVAARLGWGKPEHALEALGRGVVRSALAGSLLWVGALKFAEYETENIRPMVSTSPLFSWINARLGARKTAALIGIVEIALGTLLAEALGARELRGHSDVPEHPQLPPHDAGGWQQEHGFPVLSLEGQFLAKDGVLLGASILTAAESLRAARQARALGDLRLDPRIGPAGTRTSPLPLCTRVRGRGGSPKFACL